MNARATWAAPGQRSAFSVRCWCVVEHATSTPSLVLGDTILCATTMSCSLLCAHPSWPSRSTLSPHRRAYTCLAIQIFCKPDCFSVSPILMHTLYQNTLPSHSHHPSLFPPPATPSESSWDLSPCHLNFQILREGCFFHTVPYQPTHCTHRSSFGHQTP